MRMTSKVVKLAIDRIVQSILKNRLGHRREQRKHKFVTDPAFCLYKFPVILIKTQLFFAMIDYRTATVFKRKISMNNIM